MTERTSVPRWDVFELTFGGLERRQPLSRPRARRRVQPWRPADQRAGFTTATALIACASCPTPKGVDHRRLLRDTRARRAAGASHASRLSPACGPVRARPLPFRPCRRYAHFPFGTTCYALDAPAAGTAGADAGDAAHTRFNKLRMMIFPRTTSTTRTSPSSISTNVRRTVRSTGTAELRHVPACRQADRDAARHGLEADLILFHACDRWGYRDMGHARDFRYLRFLARGSPPMPTSGGRPPTNTISCST